jgi:hypothetical protein
MNIEDRDKTPQEILRSITFREFADRWLDGLDPELDPFGDLWIELHREAIYNEILALQQKCEAALRLLEHLGTKEAYEAAAQSMVSNELRLPAYETMLPFLRLLGAKDEDNFLTIVSLINYAQRLKKTETSNIKTD